MGWIEDHLAHRKRMKKMAKTANPMRRAKHTMMRTGLTALNRHRASLGLPPVSSFSQRQWRKFRKEEKRKAREGMLNGTRPV